MEESRGKSWSCLCQTANPVALNGLKHRANAQVTAAVLITNGRCLILFLKSHSFTLPDTHTHRQTAKSYVALRLNSFARWICLRASCESYPVSSTCCTQRLLRHPFPIYRGGALQRAFVEHTVSFIGQTLNLKAWWGVY